MHREYHRWFSRELGRDMELLVLGHAGTRVLAFPTRCGRYYDYEGFGTIDGARERIEAGHLQFYCVDSIDSESFYCNWCPPADRIRRHARYERYLMQEVLPLSEHNNPHSPLIALGCSLGAYHAINLAFRHPRRFVKAVGLSGRYDLTATMPDFADLLDGYYDDEVYFHTPSHYIPNLSDWGTIEALRRLHICLIVGCDDPFRGNNEQLSGQLWSKGIAHEFHLWAGRAHRPFHWREMLRLYL